MMRNIKFIGMAFVAIVLSLGICACSDDEKDNPSSKELADILPNTTWKVISDSDDDYHTGMLFTFNKDKSVTTTPADWWWDDTEYEQGYEWGSDWEENGVWWSANGDILTIDYNHDDCTEGTFIIDGNTATYTYRWYDYDGEWANKEYDTMKLDKQ